MTEKQQREQQLLSWIQSATSFRCQSLEMVSGDASFRRYFRFNDTDKQTSIIAVDAPPPNEDSRKFVEIANAYHDAGVNVPRVLAHNPSKGFYCLQDFGDRQFAQEVNIDNMHLLYKNAIGYLPAIQACQTVNGEQLPSFDDDLLGAELYLFTHWLLKIHLDVTLTSQQQEMIKRSYRHICDVFKSQPQAGVHRDYHSRNLMILGDESIGVIDFQDAVIGPITYDLVSLLRDCYQSWPQEKIDQVLLNAHKQFYSEYAFEHFKYWFDMTGIQRHIKASGIFCRLFHRDGKSGYLDDIPHTLDYIIEIAKNHQQLAELSEFVAEVVKPTFLERQQ